MKAKDTVISSQQMLDVMCSIPPKKRGEDYSRLNKAMCNKQAEISFKAGIKEVVEWFEQNINYKNSSIREWDKWQAKLKEWECEVK